MLKVYSLSTIRFSPCTARCESVCLYKDLNTYVHAALLLTAPNKRQGKCPPTEGRVNRWWWLHQMEHSELTRNGPLIQAITALMNHRIVMLHEKRQNWVHTVWFYLYEIPGNTTDVQWQKPDQCIPRDEAEGWELSAICWASSKCQKLLNLLHSLPQLTLRSNPISNKCYQTKISHLKSAFNSNRPNIYTIWARLSPNSAGEDLSDSLCLLFQTRRWKQVAGCCLCVQLFILQRSYNSVGQVLVSSPSWNYALCGFAFLLQEAVRVPSVRNCFFLVFLWDGTFLCIRIDFSTFSRLRKLNTYRKSFLAHL